jgi:protein dithiol oxidoreductase (disulfide-forming)
MKRREFSAGVLAAGVAGLPGLASAQKPPQDGTEYRRLDKPVPVEAPAGKIEVIEFFWYSCPHCNAFEPKLVSWIKRQPPDVFVRRVPVAFRDDFVPQQRLYYTLEAMGRLEELHPKVFETIHRRNNPLNREDRIMTFVQENGLEAAKFTELYNSFTVSTKARRAVQVQDAFKIGGVPSIGVAGRYYTDGDMAGTMDKALQVTEYLIAEARKTR